MIGLFYRLMRSAYSSAYGQQQMLHYPVHGHEGQTLMEGQIGYTEMCLSFLPSLAGKRLLDVGCGNGVQTIHIHERHKPAATHGIDINPMHVKCARLEAAMRKLEHLTFAVDDAQRLRSARAHDFDVVACTESAHHYPNKSAFLNEVRRVLKPGGHLLVAELLRREEGAPNWLERRLSLHYWTLAQYEGALSQSGLHIIATKDVTGALIEGLKSSSLPPAKRDGGLALRAARLFGRLLVKLYTHQLSGKLVYRILVARHA